MSVEQQTEHRIVYIGCELIDGKLSNIFKLVDANNKLGMKLTFKRCKSTNGYIVGSIYRVMLAINDEVTTVNFGSMKFEQAYPDPELRGYWATEDYANRAMLTAQNQAKKLTEKEILKAMLPLRQFWRQTNPANRTALEIRVLNYLRYGEDL